MKNRLLPIFAFIYFSIGINAQNIGIDTANPQSILHIDAKKDNNKVGSPTQSQLYNDVLIRQDANIGIGSLPENNARINISTDTSISTEVGKGFRLKDGTEGNGNMLSVSNTDGDIVWMPRIGTISGVAVNSKIPVNSDLVASGTYITLPKGKWLISSTILLRVENPANANNAIDGSLTEGVFGRMSWADKNEDGVTYTPTADAVSGNLFGGAYYSIYGLAFGQTVINNTSSTPKTYYLVTRTPTFWGETFKTMVWRNLGGLWGENAIIAFPAN